MNTFWPVVPTPLLGLRMKPPASTPAYSWGRGHWPSYQATGRVIGPLAHSARWSVLGLPRASAHPDVGTAQLDRPAGPGEAIIRRKRATPGVLLAAARAAWLRPALCPRSSRSRAPPAIRLTEPAQLTAHKRAGLHCLPAPKSIRRRRRSANCGTGSARPH